MTSAPSLTPIRHAELVSASIRPLAQLKRWQAQPHSKVTPFRVCLIDQVYFPLPLPVFQLFLPRNRGWHVSKQFKVDEVMDGVSAGEARDRTVAMLPKAGDEPGGYADVERAIMPAGEDIGAGLTILRHGTGFAAGWMLKQVQHDEWEVLHD